ncbi:hypothetical protein Taro_016380 [Colocasia esculenta]|uniref:PB1 domain-containing protein n=1 Tax=Colocasia esculenta TaxID=4460 RepID=A0A843UW41_COLES|nr:hypothetical protein [Colocasia esculenta]
MAAPHAETGSGQSNTNNHAAHASYPDSGESSPQSRGTDCDGSAPTAAWDDLPPPLPPHHSSRHGHHLAQRVKFMCSYGGRIQPRAHDNQLSYVGGDTKIVAVDRSIRYPQLLARLSALMPAGYGEVCFKYQLPGEDLDALISVTNDEDIEHMIVEYDRLQRSSGKPARLRLFLFPVEPFASGIISSDAKPSDRQWFVDALNSVPAPAPAPLTNSIPPPVPPPESSIGNPDFLFGLEKACDNFLPPVAIHDLAPEAKVSADSSPIDDGAPETTGSDSTKEDNWIGGGGEPPVAHQPEIQRQIQGLETLHIASQQETSGAAYYMQQQQRRESTDEENHSNSYPNEYSLQPEVQVVQENAPAARQIPVAYLPERMLPKGSVYSSIAGLDRPLYLIPPPAPQGVYSGTVVPALASQAGQGYYVATRQSVASQAPLHQTVYTVAPAPPPQPSAKTVGAYAKQGIVEASGGITAPAPQLLTAYDSAGRPLYYLRPGPPAGGGTVMPAYQTQRATSAADAVRSGAIPQPTQQPQLATPAAAVATAVTTAQLLNPESNKISAKQPLQASS